MLSPSDWVKNIMDADHTQIDTAELTDAFRCGIQLAYMGKLRKKILRERIGIEDEVALYAQLRDIGDRSMKLYGSIENAEDARHMRGFQFELGVHLLNARRNVRQHGIFTSMWPSLPRQDSPRRSAIVEERSVAYRVGWDAGLSVDGFYAETDAQRYLQLKTVPGHDTRPYAPHITVITGSTDLGTTTSEEIVRLVSEETKNGPEAERMEASARLDTLEAAFFRRLGYLA